MSNDSLYEKVGFILADIKNIGQKVDGVMQKVDCIDKKLIELNGTTVRVKDYESRSKEMESKFALLEKKIGSPTIQHKKFVSKLKSNLGLLITVFSLVSMLSVGAYKISHFIVDIEKAIKVSKIETTKSVSALKKEIEKINLPYSDTLVNTNYLADSPITHSKTMRQSSTK